MSSSTARRKARRPFTPRRAERSCGSCPRMKRSSSPARRWSYCPDGIPPPRTNDNWQRTTDNGPPPMFVAKVTGSVVATQKVASMTGQKLLVVEPYRVDEADPSRLKPTGRTFVAVDTVGAGTGEFVLIVQGSSARLTPETKQLPVDAAIIGIVDSVHLDQQCVFKKD